MEINNGYRGRFKAIITFSIVLALVTLLMFPAVNAAVKIPAPNNDLFGDSITSENEENGAPVPLIRKVGIYWWVRGDESLLYTQEDAEGFMNTLVENGWSSEFNLNDETLFGYQLEDGLFGKDQDYLEQTHIAYYAGHGGPSVLMINPHTTPKDMVYYYECSWGDENDRTNKWIALQTCLATNNYFKRAMKGTHLILGWTTWCDDAPFGATFADYLISGRTLKEAWFLTGVEHSVTRHLEMRIFGENTDMGNDHLFGFGYVNPDPPVDNIITFWDCPVNCYPPLIDIPDGPGQSINGQSSSSQSTPSGQTTGMGGGAFE